jgi:hypothetical protein
MKTYKCKCGNKCSLKNGRCKSCSNRARKGKYTFLHSNETKRKMSFSHKGMKQSEATKRKLALQRVAELNPNWMGDRVGLIGLHVWIKRHKPKPQFCECCKTNPPYDLANISGEYKRDINDFEWLCRRCHMHKDKRILNLKQYSNG